MALLQRTRILPNERLDLPDYNRIEDFVCADFKAIHKKVLANENFVIQGFVASGIGTNTLSVVLAESAAVIGGDDGVLFIGAPSLSPLATSSLSPGTTNYVEIYIDQDTGGADSRAFWDPTAAGGQGAEFSQIVDTFTFLKANLNISTSNFSGDPDKAKICEVDVNGSGVITAIRDRRDLYYRLGRGTDPTHSFPWSSRTEPANTQFTGADKDIKTQKQMNDALMDSIREIKGTTYWFEQAPITLGGTFQNVGLSILTAATSSARFSWSGTQLSITDDNGTPTDSDVLAYIRLFNSSSVIALTRQQSAQAISIANDQVLWVELPDPLANVTYDGVGVTSLNYRVSARGSVPLDDDTYWLAYRDGNRLYVRGLGELEPGEEHQISDETSIALGTLLGFDPENATTIPYTSFPSGSFPSTFTNTDSLTTAISVLAEDLNYLGTILNGNAYNERLAVVSGAPANDNEITGPVLAGTNISLPLDSHDGNSSELYTVGQGFLEVYLNGVFLLEGIDWVEVGTIGNTSSTFQLTFDLVVGDELTLRIDTAGGITSVGGSGTLQDAYNLGSTIITDGVNPFTVGGTTPKVAQFNGDIGVTGVIDPKGITFSREASNPLTGFGMDGLWFDTDGKMHLYQDGVGDTNVSDILGGSSTSVANKSTVENQSGQNLVKGTPVRIDSNGYAAPIDVSVEAEAFAACGVISSGIADAASGDFVTAGIIQNITGFNFGDVLYVSKTGDLTATKPSIGVDGFMAGDFVIRVGVVQRNVVTPAQKDLIVNVQVVGQL